VKIAAFCCTAKLRRRLALRRYRPGAPQWPFAPRLHAGYSFATSRLSNAVHDRSRRFKHCPLPALVHSCEPHRTRLKGPQLCQHPEIALPKPGFRGSIPFRDANFAQLSMYGSALV
jgi:hypothetical protein